MLSVVFRIHWLGSVGVVNCDRRVVTFHHTKWREGGEYRARRMGRA